MNKEKKETGLVALILSLTGYVFLIGLIILLSLYPQSLYPGASNSLSWLSPMVTILMIGSPLLNVIAAFCAAFRLNTARGIIALVLSILYIAPLLLGALI